MGYHERLIELRKKNNYTQEELAGIIGVSRQAISKWESGLANPDIEKLIKLSELYGCSIDYIVGNDNKIDENRTNDELNKNIDEANNSENNNDNILSFGSRNYINNSKYVCSQYSFKCCKREEKN